MTDKPTTGDPTPLRVAIGRAIMELPTEEHGGATVVARSQVFDAIRRTPSPVPAGDDRRCSEPCAICHGDDRGAGWDVERLARAQVRSGIDTFLPGEDRWISANEAQAAIAREYAALSGESGEPDILGDDNGRTWALDQLIGSGHYVERFIDGKRYAVPVGESGEPKECPHCLPGTVNPYCPEHAVGESGEPKEPTQAYLDTDPRGYIPRPGR